MSDTPDYLGNRQVEPGDKVDYGIPGMKWGQRRSRAQLKAAKSTSTESSSGDKPKKAPANETSSQRYSRLQGEAKEGRSKQLSDEDLKWFNARTEALSKIDKLNKRDPDWLRKTSKQVLQEVAKESMKAVIGAAAVNYISGPIVDQIKTKK